MPSSPPKQPLFYRPARSTRGPNVNPKPRQEVSKSKEAKIRVAPPTINRVVRNVPAEKWSPPAEELEVYRGLLDDDLVDLIQVDPRTWVAEVYNISQDHRKDGWTKWTHVSATINNDFTLNFACSNCPQNRAYKSCVHSLILESDKVQHVLFSSTTDPLCIAFSHEKTSVIAPSNTAIYTTMFSVSARVAGPPGPRVLVRHIGTAALGGKWECKKCTHNQSCKHIESAMSHLQDLKILPLGSEGSDDELNTFSPPTHYADLRSEVEKLDERSVSNVQIGPPIWARTSAKDDDISGPYKYVRPLPTKFAIGDDIARCRCGATAPKESPIILTSCKIYDTDGARTAIIETQKCPNCKLSAGPDLGNIGVFNWNNKTLVAHSLFNKFDAQFSNSETTFHAFCASIRMEYESCASEEPFMGEDDFRTCWFSFMKLQTCQDTFKCAECGDSPEVVIADGVTVAFQRRKRTSMLRPPTFISPTSIRRDHVRPPKAGKGSQLVQNRHLRKEAMAMIHWRIRGGKGSSPNQDLDVDIDQEENRPKSSSSCSVYTAQALERVAEQLANINSTLGSVFEAFVARDVEDEKPLRSWRELLLQLVAHESVLQLAPVPTWTVLKVFIEEVERESIDSQRLGLLVQRVQACVPAIGTVATQALEGFNATSDKDNLCDIAKVTKFVLDNSKAAWREVRVHGLEPERHIDEGDWAETGCCYGTPQIRERPKYKGIPNDFKIDRNVVSGNDGIGCSKYFAEYGKRGYTGGILAFWCTHGICLGFHCIPEGEGRNDVFAALYTRWPIAPKFVIYDFACALAPYCMMREAEFFKDTRFLIDKFHSSGHKTCSAACFLTTYAPFNQVLATLNSSAAEFGNSGLKRIRKSLSYMSQRHAMIFIHRFICLWNRLRRRALLKKIKATRCDF